MKRCLLTLIMSIVILVFMSVNCLAKEPANPSISLNETIEKAFQHSYIISKASLEVNREEAMRDYRSDQLNYIPIGAPINAQTQVAWSSILMADLTWQMSKKSLDLEEDRLVMDVCKKYWAVLRAHENLDAKKKNLHLAELEMRRADTSFGIGLISNLERLQVKTKLEGSRADVASSENELEEAYAKLNNMIGLWPQDRPVLTDKLELHPLEIVSLDYAVQLVIEKSPAVWLAQERVTLQSYLEDMMFYTGDYRPYQARKIEVKQAELDALSTKDAVRMATRELYYVVSNMEEAYKVAEQDLIAAEEALRVTKLKYDVGMTTALDVAQREAVLSESKRLLIDIVANHSFMKLAFQKPWAIPY